MELWWFFMVYRELSICVFIFIKFTMRTFLFSFFVYNIHLYVERERERNIYLNIIYIVDIARKWSLSDHALTYKKIFFNIISKMSKLFVTN